MGKHEFGILAWILHKFGSIIILQCGSRGDLSRGG